MKKNMLATMDRLKIDKEIRGLIRQLWKHGYRTIRSCDGHGSKGYVLLREGDGWFEKNSDRYGLIKIENKECCQREYEEEVKRYCLNPNSFVDKRKACKCGAGVNGYSIYRGKLIKT